MGKVLVVFALVVLFVALVAANVFGLTVEEISAPAVNGVTSGNVLPVNV